MLPFHGTKTWSIYPGKSIYDYNVMGIADFFSVDYIN